MTTVACSTSMASAFNVVLNLVCIWLLLIVMTDLRKIRNSGKNFRGGELGLSAVRRASRCLRRPTVRDPPRYPVHYRCARGYSGSHRTKCNSARGENIRSPTERRSHGASR